MCEPADAVGVAAAPRIDLQRWTSYHWLRNGTRLRIRPLCSGDREREIAFIASLSERTRYLRFMSPLRFLPRHLLDQLMTIDYHGSMAFVATVEEGAAERFVGLARYGVTDAPGTAELGITVTDAWQRQGIARLLMECLLEYAARQGLHTMIGWVLYENQPMLALARACGFRLSIAPQQLGMQIERELQTPLAG